MKSYRQLFHLAALVLIMLLPTAHAQVPAAHAVAGITIVIPLSAKGSSRAESVAAMRDIAAFVARQPGLIDAVLMENNNPANTPSHVHVTRWFKLGDWEALFSNPEFKELARRHQARVSVADGTAIFTPLK
ncbi:MULTISPECIES: hypothetical protein [unclassified Undibacterium]|uniref:hypothetical protein n=1 Tax=unclassified Undibacterium TaxID=2630295 RepID=UPI002AC9AC04|nr:MULTISPECIES: hypothetical protein [unclassified Undibacterium]MEB0139782.1 hypothetical protein [Undibacterium sp. CCC2.1]MEB0170510.1 hypothetical protein [Undibacterium sp. CCC1.1]MEB0174451.1 hypothetical protein [Undibacterium sp. CCC3.4]MEB0213752.1 hypothetical protein [Undibacterium sp. 5I2]WPX43915.1 hypothetical protein RHM61_01390 [Undibacterium sp. CCC3.4]